jgi:hypothetical protein
MDSIFIHDLLARGVVGPRTLRKQTTGYPDQYHGLRGHPAAAE